MLCTSVCIIRGIIVYIVVLEEINNNNMASEGADVPNVIFKARVRDESIGGPNPFKWKDVTSEDLFKGKRVVLFALPGGKDENNFFHILSS